MNYDTMTTADLLMLLGSRERRLDAWDKDERYLSRSEYSDTDDERIVLGVAEVLAKRIDAGCKEQP